MGRIGNKLFALLKRVKMEQKYKGWTIIVDCDGCLTDGKKYVDATGKRQMIAFHSRDSIACKALVEMGFQIFVVTLSRFEGISSYWTKYGATVVVPATKLYPLMEAKKRSLETLVNWKKTIGLGDDITDLSFLEKCGKAFCVNDAHPLLLAKSGKFTNLQRLKCNGGQGVLSEILYLIQSNQINAND